MLSLSRMWEPNCFIVFSSVHPLNEPIKDLIKKYTSMFYSHLSGNLLSHLNMQQNPDDLSHSTFTGLGQTWKVSLPWTPATVSPLVASMWSAQY